MEVARMKRVNVLLIIVLLIGVVLSLRVGGKVEAKGADLRLAAGAFVEKLARGDFPDAVKSFGPPLNSSLPPEELRGTWKSILSRRGAFKKIVGIESDRVEEYGGRRYNVVVVECQFERAKMNVRISFNSAARITSLWFVPPE
jgi:uncharacterized protein